MKFRTDISFLRALSVIIVMFFHFGIRGFSGGFIGVDVFFVISGFLMTQIILRNFEKETFSLKDFYAKRIRRIIPPLQAVLLFVLLISSVFFFQSDIKLNAKYVLLADFFVSNIYFWNYQDYFTSTDNILLHSWTLGVEWQFYIIYPIMLLILRKIYFNKRKIFWIILTFLCISSLILMLWIGRANVNFIFYMLPTRFWELSVGGLAYGLGTARMPGMAVKKSLAILGIITIVVANLLISENNLWPSFLTVIPVLATVIILAVNVNFSFFNNASVKFLGDISYSLYLWHWPWFILLKYFGFVQIQYTIVLIILSVASAYLSYIFIESKKKITTVKISLMSTSIIGFLSIVLFYKPTVAKSFSIYQNEKFEIGDYKAKYIATEKEKQFNPCGCFITNNQTIKNFDKEKCLAISRNKPNILLIGDSHAAQFSSSFRKLEQYNILEASVGYTFPLLNSKGKKGLVELNDFIFSDFIPANKNDIELVIISAHWLMRHNVNLYYTEDEVLQKLNKTIAFFNSNKISYLIIGQTETYTLPYPKILMLSYIGREEQTFINNEADLINKKIKHAIPPDNYIDIYSSRITSHFDSATKTPYMFDSNHFTTFGADQIINKIISQRIEKKIRSN